MHCSTRYSSLYGYSCIRHGLQAVLHQMVITSAVCLLGVHLLEKYAAADMEALSPAVPCIVPSICIACTEIDQTWKSLTMLQVCNSGPVPSLAAAPCGVEGGHSIPEHHHWHSQADCAHGSVGAGLGRGSTEEEQPISPLA